MTLFPLLFALILEQFKPLAAQRWVVEPLSRIADKMVDLYNDGEARSGQLAWWLMVAGLTLGATLVWFALWQISAVLAFAFNIGVLYLVLAHGRESRLFRDIVMALSVGDVERARVLVGEWRGRDHAQASAGELTRLTIEQGLVTAHRNVFGAIFWLVLLPGPGGAVMYRVARHLAEAWGERRDESFGHFGEFARRAFEVIDWVPVRFTALAFSVIGNFEDAIYCWRSQSMLWENKASGILVASGAGALGVRLGLPIHESGSIVDRPEMGVGGKADVGHIQATAKLIWRVLVLVLLVLTLLGIAGWVGR